MFEVNQVVHMSVIFALRSEIQTAIFNTGILNFSIAMYNVVRFSIGQHGYTHKCTSYKPRKGRHPSILT